MSNSEASTPEPPDVALADLPLLNGLPDAVRELVAEAFVPEAYGFGEEIVRQGDEPDGFYVVHRGRARAVMEEHGHEVPLGTFGPGDSFGEIGLLDGAPRTATVRASGPVDVLRLEPALFRAIAARHPAVRTRLQAVARSRRIEPLLARHPIFSVLPREAIVELAPRLQEVRVPAGAEVFNQGDPPGPMYIVFAGRLRVRDADDGDLRYLRAGDVFGEISVQTGAARTATVDAVSDVALLALSEPVFRELASAHPAVAERAREQRLLHEQGRAVAVPLDFAAELLPAAASQANSSARETPEIPLADRSSAAAAPRLFRGRRHVRHMRQLDQADCGAACVAMLCRHFGHPVAISVVREACGTAIDGTSLRGIQRGGTTVGLELRPSKISRERLDSLELPAIVHWHGDHWMVLDEVRGDRVHVADPATASRWIGRDAFLEQWTGFAATAAPTPELANAPKERLDLRWLRPIVRPYARRLALVVFLALAAASLQMLVPVITGQIIDHVIPQGNYTRLYVLIAALAALQLLALGAGILRARVLTRAAVGIDAATLDHVASRMFRLPLRFFETRRTGDIEARLDSMREVREFAVQHGSYALTYVTQIVVASVFMIATSTLLGLIWLATIPVYIVLARASARRMRPAYAELQEGFGRYRARRLDAIKGIETVKGLGREEALRRTMVDDFGDIARRVVRADMTSISYAGAVSFVTYTFLVLFLFAGSLEVMAGNMTIGDLVAFNSLALLAAGPLLGLLDLWDSGQLAAVNLARLRDVLDQEPEQAETAEPMRAVPTLEGRVSLRRLGFRYPTMPDVAILEDVALDVTPGMTVALVGRSGSGKSTLLRCLAGLLTPTEGTIEIDGIDLRELDWVSLRRRIGSVPQHPYIFDGTIAENIAFGEADPDPDAVRAAAEIADAHTFIERLPLGYKTRIGEGGMRLSGGQSQRIAIARAIFHQPPVLLLDEATSALDSEAERTVTANLRRLLEGRTAFVVAHRLSTVRDADQIVVLEQGRVAETGTHDELLAAGGLYVHLYGQQLG